MSTYRSRAMVTAALLALTVGPLSLGAVGPAEAADPGPAAPAATAKALNVLVLGDSYAAGNGSTDDQGNEQYYGPADCYRSRVDWGEKYAAALRAGGQPVTLVNHACSGGVTADFTHPRVLDSASHVEATPAGVTTQQQENASLAKRDPCNTGQFPGEEFWSYATTAFSRLASTYSCTRMVRPQNDFVTPQTDLVLYTMGGNDIGFSTIVQSCFVPVLRTAASCRSAVDAARALLPAVRQRLLAALTDMRAHGLRDDAKVVQLGYPRLQVDNGFTLTDATGTYDAGNEVRALSDDGDAAIAAGVPDADIGHPGQVSFLEGVPQKFAGHEPDASSLAGNPERWINQIEGTTTAFWYHPNRLGQTAYAELLAAHGTFGAVPSGSVESGSVARARLHVRVRQLGHARKDDARQVRLVVRVTLADGSVPHGRIVVRGLPGHHGRLGAKRLHKHDHGRVRLVVRVPAHGVTRIRVVYRDRHAPVVKRTHRIHRSH